MRARLLVILFCFLFPLGASAVQPDEILADPRLEARARNLSAGLRCLVCQNQSIDDSNAPLARDLRILVRERLKAGDTDDQVLEFAVARYGDFILLKPPFNAQTITLWLLPALILLLAAFVIFLNIRRRDVSVAAGAQLDASEETRLREILDKNPP